MENSRVAVTDIAAELGVTETAIRKRIKKLEAIGAIKGYTTIVDPFFMGYNSVALVGIDATPEKIITVFDKIKKMPETKNVALTTGDHMIMFEVWCKDQKELRQVMKKVEETEGVTRICPAIYIKRME